MLFTNSFNGIIVALRLIFIFAALAAAHKPSVKWIPCDKSWPSIIECGKIDVPMNHAVPEGAKVTLAVARQKTNQTCGPSRALFMDNGGPGSANVASLVKGAISLAQGNSNGPADEMLRLAYDQIAVDVRGTGFSTPLKCDPHLWNQVSYSAITDEASYTDRATRVKAFGNSCINMTGPLINYLGTDQTIQDFDLVREALGYDKFNYLGFSYGTKIGHDYAQRYPHKVGRMVLDGVTNYGYSIEDKWSVETFGLEATLNDFFSWCNKTTECALYGQDQPHIWDSIMDWAANGELKNSTCETQHCDDDKSSVNDSQVVFRTVLGFHDGTQPGKLNNYQNVSQTLHYTYVTKSDEKIVEPPETEAALPVYAEIAIQCADRPTRKLSAADFRNVNTLLGALAPHTRDRGIQARISVLCNEWPVPARNPPEVDLDQMRKLPPVMLVNAFFDPALPSPLGLGMRPQMPTAFSVYRNGGGHTSFSHQGATAMAEAAFLVNGTMPVDGTVYQT